MTKLPKLHLVALLLSCCLPLVSAAQDNERWYQVELLIFSHEGDDNSEQWEATPTLAYPGASRFLVYPQQNEARLEQYSNKDETEAEVDEFGRQFIRITRVEASDTEEITTEDIPPLEPTVSTDVLTDETPGTETLAEDEAALLLPTPFIALPRASRELHGKAAYMGRTGYYKTLFHETWVQPVRSEPLALPLVIDRSGDTETWPRLQGSVTLHLSRYLHIETNLWLNTHGDYLPGEWRMPEPPLGPVSIIVEEPEPEPESDPEPEDTPYYVADEPLPRLDEESLEGEETLEPQGPVYPWRHAVLLKQKRKMRSNEVHYIDHPLLGVVVKLTPLDEEQLDMMGAAELATSSDQPGPG